MGQQVLKAAIKALRSSVRDT